MIEIRNLKKSFGQLKVLQGMDASFEKGQVVAIIGPNASGKTTLIKCILGMVLPDAGDVLLNNERVNGAVAYKQHIGYMPQIGRYPDNMKMGQLFEMMKDIRVHNRPAVLDEELIRRFRLSAMYQKPMSTLSGGTRQKVSAALAFLFDPPVLILDEPTAGLDPLSAEILKHKIIAAREAGKLVLITSHIMSEIEEMADAILYIFEGKVKFLKTVTAIKSEYGDEKLGKAIANYILQEMNNG